VRSSSLTVAAVTTVLLLIAAPAAAHVMLMPGDVEPGETLDTDLLVVHGCGPGGTIPSSDDEVSPTTAVTFEVPAPLDVTPNEMPGWSITTDRAADGSVEIRWDNEDEAGTSEPIYLDVTIDASALDEEREFWFPAVQECADGERMYWTLPGMEERDGQLPGVSFGVTAAAPTPNTDTGPSTLLLVTIVLVIAGAAGAASFVFSGRRGATDA